MDKYQTLSSKTLLETKVFDVQSDRVVLPNGSETTRFIVQHPGAVVIVPRSASGTFLLVRQYRHAIASTILEFPAGTLETGEAPLDCAKREIIEEVGHAASSWQPLGRLYPAPGFCSEIQHLFYATELQPEFAEGDEDEIIEVVEMSLEEVKEAIAKEEMADGKSLAAFLRAQVLGLI